MFPHSFASDEIKFCLMAIVSDRRMECEKEIAKLEQRKELAAQRVSRAQRGTCGSDSIAPSLPPPPPLPRLRQY